MKYGWMAWSRKKRTLRELDGIRKANHQMLIHRWVGILSHMVTMIFANWFFQKKYCFQWEVRCEMSVGEFEFLPNTYLNVCVDVIRACSIVNWLVSSSVLDRAISSFNCQVSHGSESLTLWSLESILYYPMSKTSNVTARPWATPLVVHFLN